MTEGKETFSAQAKRYRLERDLYHLRCGGETEVSSYLKQSAKSSIDEITPLSTGPEKLLLPPVA